MNANDWISARVSQVVQETPIDRTFRLSIEGDVSFEAQPGQVIPFGAQPGQYVMLRIPSEDPPRERAYSLSGILRDDLPLRITVRGVGDWGAAVYGLTEGTPVEVKAPTGDFVLDVAPENTLLLIGGGSGITPFRTFVEHLIDVKHEGSVTVLQSSQSDEHVLFRDEFTAWAETHGWLTYEPIVTGPDDDPESAARQISPAMLASRVSDPAQTILYACGPKGMVDAMLAGGAALSIPADRLRKESW